MTWFIVLSAMVHGVPHNEIGDMMTGFRFPTQAACLDDVARRADALAAIDIHGRYMCMFHNETTREMRTYNVVRDF